MSEAHRLTSPVVATLVLTLVVAACGGAAASAPSPAGPSVPTASVAPPSVAPSASAPTTAIAVEDLVADPGARDGQLVRVTGNFLADETHGAQLCAVMMESYPPQCGGGAARITGEVGADSLARLSHTTEPGLAKAWWGYVVVVGTFRAAGPDGRPVIELGSIELHEG
jgi:hypothetical protein